ncbi:MAG: RNase adapter RapZ, partial [Mariprofundaceae bacterium]|nr:RNase adapter RapZ [Mariprofundaceae bacterium]
MLMMISGLSGAGKSTALHALEDLGFFCTDNLPVDMLPLWAERMKDNNAAVCIDIRSSKDPKVLLQALEEAKLHHDWRILFIDSSSDVLKRRFSTLRRKHPFRPNFSDDMSLASVIDAEKKHLQPLKEHADLVLNSSDLNPYELAEMVESFWRIPGVELPYNDAMVCTFTSFSYQRGLPSDADLVVDVRFLPNPHYQPELAVKTGRDKQVEHFFHAHPEVAEAEDKLKDWLTFIWPKLKRERKRYFTVALGCSGGRHRSVYLTERLAAWAKAQHLTDP